MNTSSAARSPTSKTDYVLERLRQEIMTGEIRQGAALRQADLAERYGVSPTPVREALRLLEAEGAITYSPHRGASVTEVSPHHLEDLYLLRAVVEGLAVQLAVERLTDDEIADIRAKHEELVGLLDGGDPDDLWSINRDLHDTLCLASSPLIAKQVATLWRMFPSSVTIWQDPVIARELADQHAGILEALEARDAELANARMRAHILAAGVHRKRQLDAPPSAH